MEFQPKNAVLCGASKGNGQAVLIQLIEQFNLDFIFAISRTGTVSTELANKAQESGCQLIPISCDVEKVEELDRAYAVIAQRTTKIDLLINTVGFLSSERFQPEKSLRSLSIESLQYSIQKNTWPALAIVQRFQKLFRHREPTRLVFYSARVGSSEDNGLGGWYAYRISKAALNMAVRNISIELGRNKPDFCCYTYHPGTVDTDLSRPFTKRYTRNKIFSPEQAALYMIDVLCARTAQDNGRFFDWKGESIPF